MDFMNNRNICTSKFRIKQGYIYKQYDLKYGIKKFEKQMTNILD